MALLFNSATRINPAPCQHFEVSVTFDGVTYTKSLTPGELEEMADEVSKAEFIAKLLAYYFKTKGYTLAQLTGKDLLRDVL